MQGARQRCEQALHGAGLVVRAEDRVELVVERAHAFRRGGDLRDARETPPVDDAEPLGEVHRQLLGGRRACRARAPCRRITVSHRTRAENRDDAPGQQPSRDPIEVVADVLCLRFGAQRPILAQHGRMDLLQLGARLDAELAYERLSRVLEGLQRVRLTARAVEGEHEHAPQPLAEGIPCDERFQRGDRLAISSHRDTGVELLLGRDETPLLEPPDLLRANVSCSRSAKAEPRQRPSASVRRRTRSSGSATLDCASRCSKRPRSSSSSAATST